MPAQFLLVGQLSPYSRRKIPPRAACVHVITGYKIAASQRTCHNPDIPVQTNVQLVGNVLLRIGKI